MILNKIHLSEDQKVLCREFWEDYQDRPSEELYRAYQKLMTTIDKGRTKPKPKEIPNTERGFEKTEVRLLSGFDALKDLPEGWAVYPMFDSGNNHAITSAGQHVLTKLWNNWDGIRRNPQESDSLRLIETPT